MRNHYKLAARRWAVMLVAFLAMGLASFRADAQVLYGSIVGNVTDPQGSVLPGVSVKITNTGTGLTLETTTDDTGSYVFRNLPTGNYNMTLSAKGFKELKQEAIVVTAGNPKRADAALQIGGTTESVTVTADAATLKTEKADLNTEINSKQVLSLPLNQYRNYQSLLNLVPGATPTQFQNAEIDTPGRSLRTWVNGTQPNSNTTRVDGAVSVNVWLPHHAGYIQPAETVETVNIATNNFDADTGMAGGAAQTVVTKSGTNDFRGSAFWFFNGDKLNANSFINNANGLVRPPQNRNTYGGTLGGRIIKDKLFFFASYENFRDRRTSNVSYTVPTDKMRLGDFTEVLAVYPAFRLFDPATGAAGGTGRTEFGTQIPTARISPIARSVMNLYPKVNQTRDVNGNLLLDDFVQQRQVQVDRGNYDGKLTWQRTKEHAIWGKFSTLRANVVDNFNLGFDEGSLGDTKVYVVSVGHTWTLSPTLLLDGNFGYNRQDQTVTGPDYGKNLGIELGIPGTNDPKDIRASGLPTFANGYTIGTTPNWMPLFRKELNYSFSSALTKVFAKHELRAGVDVVKLTLDHRQAEFGDYGLKGGFSFSSNTTGASNYIPVGGGTWNAFAGFLLGLPSFFSKDVQTETMTGREWQNAVYLRDRWRVTPNLTLNLGLRLENYPLMTRANSGIERLDYATYNVILGGRGNQPKDVGLDLQKWYLAPRLGAAYRLGDKSVVRAGYGRTINPLPWSRPLRGSFPYDITFNNTANPFGFVTTLATGIPTVPVPDFSSGVVRLPANVFMRSPNFGGFEPFPGAGKGLDRAVIQQWNFTFEHKLPWNIIIETGYVGTRTDGGYADLNINYGEPGAAADANARRKYFSVAGNTAINDWGARTRSRYHSLQTSINRPFQNGLLLKGAYTLSKAKNMADEDGWVGLTWNHPLKFEDNFALASFDRTHVWQMGFVYSLPFFKSSNNLTGKLLGGWQVNGIHSWYSGTPYSIGGTNNGLNCASCGSVLINFSGDPKPVGRVGSYTTETYYDKSLFSQPSATDITKTGFGTSLRNNFRRPRVWNADLSLFKQFRVTERIQPEFRVEASNFFNHTNWGAPITTFTAANFLQFVPANAESGTNSPGARRIQMGLRVQF
ncbi:MAG TPA: TonB-dependent receptor [Blastocatellia bacterium]|nr:TonB-dependent receptor [Blastocatellia bacterium]HMV82681.1 TonB-dependent receptor [Blastocatellia bacterium]HMX24480.1 TonB-dependent receptor [Blastocatellia bacterium]HMZ16802.1 TonB-dependent receptor [Blastocatellia bacterium]HNG30430.1 TonB-dependent receptor [Blastocatellia bacterium]